MQCCPHVRRLIALAFPVLVTLLLVSCGDDRPSGILTETQMIPVLKDLHIAYSGVDLTTPDVSQREGKYAELNHVVFDKYKVDEKVFFESYEYYQRNPRLMDTIYNEVINALNLELAPLNGDKPVSKPPGTMTVNPSNSPGEPAKPN